LIFFVSASVEIVAFRLAKTVLAEDFFCVKLSRSRCICYDTLDLDSLLSFKFLVLLFSWTLMVTFLLVTAPALGSIYCSSSMLSRVLLRMGGAG